MKYKEKLFLILTILHTFSCIIFFSFNEIDFQNTLFYNFISLTIPIQFVISISLSIIWLFINYKIVTIPLLVLLSGYNSLRETYNYHFHGSNAKSDFSVLSYNVGSFNLDRYGFSIDKDTVIYVDTLNTELQSRWLDSVQADILCFQEFYNNDRYISESIISKLVRNGYVHYYTNPIHIRSLEGFFGVIIFSKYPIIKGDSIKYSNQPSMNRGVYADIKINEDTIRVINIHLHSMSIRINTVPQDFQNNLKITKNKLKKGFNERSKQIETVVSLINNSPYKVILCGDFNDLPYSYSYQKVKKVLKNAYETAGTGFGFTYNKFPFFIRIDNQFYDEGLEPNYFNTLKNNKSDHFPIEAGYSFNK